MPPNPAQAIHGRPSGFDSVAGTMPCDSVSRGVRARACVPAGPLVSWPGPRKASGIGRRSPDRRFPMRYLALAILFVIGLAFTGPRVLSTVAQEATPMPGMDLPAGAVGLTS